MGGEELRVHHNHLEPRTADAGIRTPKLVSQAIRKGPPVVGRLLGEIFYRYSQ